MLTIKIFIYLTCYTAEQGNEHLNCIETTLDRTAVC